MGLTISNGVASAVAVSNNNETVLHDGIIQGNTAWINYRGSSGTGIVNYNFANGIGTGALVPIVASNITAAGNVIGNAATATKLATARTINGVSFDGTASITIADSTKAPIPTVNGVAGTIGLVKITDTGIGYRLDRDVLANKGPLGGDAIDLSTAHVVSSTYGASGFRSLATGTYTTASGTYSTAMGFNTLASSEHSTAIGCSTTASGYSSTAMGYSSTTRSLNGAMSLAYGKYSGTAQQLLIMCLIARTTSTTNVRATANGDAASATNQFVIPDNSASFYTLKVIAKQEGLGGIANVKAFELKGILFRGTGAVNTIISPIPPTIIGAGGLPCSVDVSADTINGGLAVNCASGIPININWEIVISSSEIIGL